tara:strand:+ start:3236 stop:4153 length:918 start_codon:yes stop_codon:yes gene_type:complete
MHIKYLVSVKSSGLSYNILRLLTITYIAKKYNRQLVFLTKADHIPILKKFNRDCIYIPYVSEHTSRFNSFIRDKNIHLLYDIEYKNFLKNTYMSTITTDDIQLNNIKLINGGIRDLNDSNHTLMFFEHCRDIEYIIELLSNIPVPVFNIRVDSCKYSKKNISINVKLDDPNNKRIYEFWDELIPILKQKYNMPLILVSGNNDIKKYLGDKHNCVYEIKDTQTKYAFKRNSETIRGAPAQIFDDLLICANTHFISLMQIKEEYYNITSKYNDIEFLAKRYEVEKFDALSQYLSTTSLGTNNLDISL